MKSLLLVSLFMTSLTSSAFATETGKCKLKAFTSMSFFALKKEKKVIHGLTYDECIDEADLFLSEPGKNGETFKQVKIFWSSMGRTISTSIDNEF